MATIDRDMLLADIKMVLPSDNVLTDDQMLIVIERVILLVGDDTMYYGEVACKSMRSIADINAGKADVDIGKLKREKVGDNEEERFESSTGGQTWNDFRDSLKGICPVMFGYSFPSGKGMYINSGKIPNPLCLESYINK